MVVSYKFTIIVYLVHLSCDLCDEMHVNNTYSRYI